MSFLFTILTGEIILNGLNKVKNQVIPKDRNFRLKKIQIFNVFQ